jgi:hypothetical protein
MIQIVFPIARKPGMAWQQPQPTMTVRVAATVARRAGGLLGRPTCRMYCAREAWVLELEPANGG